MKFIKLTFLLGCKTRKIPEVILGDWNIYSALDEEQKDILKNYKGDYFLTNLFLIV